MSSGGETGSRHTYNRFLSSTCYAVRRYHSDVTTPKYGYQSLVKRVCLIGNLWDRTKRQETLYYVQRKILIWNETDYLLRRKESQIHKWQRTKRQKKGRRQPHPLILTVKTVTVTLKTSMMYEFSCVSDCDRYTNIHDPWHLLFVFWEYRNSAIGVLLVREFIVCHFVNWG